MKRYLSSIVSKICRRIFLIHQWPHLSRQVACGVSAFPLQAHADAYQCGFDDRLHRAESRHAWAMIWEFQHIYRVRRQLPLKVTPVRYTPKNISFLSSRAEQKSSGLLYKQEPHRKTKKVHPWGSFLPVHWIFVQMGESSRNVLYQYKKIKKLFSKPIDKTI